MIQQTEQSDCIPIFTEDEPTRRRGRRPFVVLATTEAVRSTALDRVAARAGVVAGEPELADALRQAEEIFEEEVEEGQILEERPIVRAEDLPPVPPAVPPPLPVRALSEAVHAMPPVPLPPPPPRVAERRTPPLPPQPRPALAAPLPRRALLPPELVLGLLALLMVLVPLPARACDGPHHGAAALLATNPSATITTTTGKVVRPLPAPLADLGPVLPAHPTQPTGCQLVPAGSTTPPGGVVGLLLLVGMIVGALCTPSGRKDKR